MAFNINENWRLNGFASQSAIHTDDNNYFGDSDDSVSTEFFEAGLVLNGSLGSKIRFSTQLLARDAGANDNGSPSFDYTFLTYEIVSNARWNTGLRLGRIPSQMGFYNATRDVPFTRPSILLPQSIYGETVRNSRFAHDGIQWYGEWNNNLDSWQWHVDYYEPLSDGSETDDIFLVPLPGEVQGEHSWMTQLIYEWDGGMGRIGVTYEVWKNTYKLSGFDLYEFVDSFQYNLALEALDFNALLEPLNLPDFVDDAILAELGRTDIRISERISNLEQLLNVDIMSLVNAYLPSLNIQGDDDIATSMLSAEYNWQQFTFTTEYMSRRIKTSGFDVDFINEVIEQEAYFVQTVYHAAPNWDLMLRHDRFYYDTDDRNGRSFHNNLPGIPQHRAFAFDTTAGVSRHISSRLMVRAEWHYVEGTIWLPINDNHESLATKKYWNMLAMQLAWRF